MSRSGVVHLIANGSAGSGHAVQRARQVQDLLVHAGLLATVVTPTSAEETSQAARNAVLQQAAAVVACGGDGTLNRVLQGILHKHEREHDHEHRVPLGLIPCGTGDDNARSLGIPADPAHAALALRDALLANTLRTVDVARIQTDEGEGWFLGVLSTGFDSSVNERANRRSGSSWLPGHLRYVMAMLAELGTFRPVDYHLVVDGHIRTGQGMLVAVGNGGNYGGGMRICPTAILDDGMLEVTWVDPVSKAAFIRVFPRVFAGTHLQHPAVRSFSGSRITVAAPGQVAYADGERFGSLPVEIEVIRGALDVVGATATAPA